MNSSEIFAVSCYAALTYTTFNLLIWVFYPTLTSIFWQGCLGKIIALRWPDFTQSNDINRYSFMMENRNGIVVKLGLSPIPFFQMLHWLWNGFSIAVFFCIFPRETVFGLIIVGLMVWVTYRMITIGFSPSNYKRVDTIFSSGRELLFFMSLLYSMKVVGFI